MENGDVEYLSEEAIGKLKLEDIAISNEQAEASSIKLRLKPLPNGTEVAFCKDGTFRHGYVSSYNEAHKEYLVEERYRRCPTELVPEEDIWLYK